MAYDQERRRRIEEQHKRHPEIKPPKVKSVLPPGERLSGAPPVEHEWEPAPPRGALMEMGQSTDAQAAIEALRETGGLVGAVGKGAKMVGNAYAENVVEPTVRAGSFLLTGQDPGQFLTGAAKEKARADTRALADAARNAHAAGEAPRGQGTDQKIPPPSGGTPHFTPGGVGTGKGASATTPPKAAGKAGPGPGKTQIKLPNGRFVFVTPNRADDYVGGGGELASYQDATAGLGAPQAARFMKDRVSGGRSTLSGTDRLPYSQQVRGLEASMPEIDLNEPGSFGATSPPASGGPTEGYGKLSGLEQALSRRQWLESRADTEQANEVQRAELDRREQLAAMDPLELARIQAQGRMGGDIAKVGLDLRARQAAVEEHQRMSAQIEAAQAKLSQAAPGSADEADLKRYIDYLIQTRREIANLLLGERLSDPRGVGDAIGMALSALAPGGGGAAPPTGAR